KALADDDLEQFLIKRGDGQGLTIPVEVVSYLVSHTQRDLAAMLKLVDTIDREALAQQRRVTVPFVRSVIPSDG
ncbi:MAG TPA: DnaA regulatory inactivator Hda, partial [Gammaproteobacteria bacterium]|nr:DnaA regulatory inactivator Hda [Gammaproteobacteria bacterium]